jgi:arabinose-5-phosphate isomerase
MAFKRPEHCTKKQDLNDSELLQIARDTLEIERQTVAALQTQINNDFAALVRRIANSTGRLIISGIGKSAIIAQKIVSTMNSTGTPALYMHAADAIHGDLGMLRPEDIVLCISKSGETEEIKVLLPLIRNFGNTLIGMSSNAQSALATQSDYFLYIPVEKEADPNNLAPTASTTAQMAMGDALATSLLALKGFTSKDFAQFHPGGSLGKQMYLRVKDLSQYNERPLVEARDDLRTTILEISSKRLGATAVQDGDDIVGIVTDGDVRRMLEKHEDVRQIIAADIMTRQPKSIQAQAYAVEALNTMRTHNIHQLIVFDGDDYIGFIHLHDLIREGIV